MARVSAGQIGVMSLPEKNLLLRFPIEVRYPEGIYHDFVIGA